MSNAFANMYNVGHHAGTAEPRNALMMEQTQHLKHQNAMNAMTVQSEKQKADFFANGGRNALAGIATGAPNAMSTAIDAGAPFDLIAEVQGIRDADIAANLEGFKFFRKQMEPLHEAAFGIAQLPASQQQQAWQQVKQQYGGMGLDVSSWPDQYGPGVMAAARQIPEAAKILDSRIAGVRTVPAGGAAGGGQATHTYRTDLHKIVDENLIPSEGTGSNPNSSARGVGQFIDSTWLEEFKKAYPELAEPLSDAQILALRDDPEIARGVTHHYAANTVWPAFQAIGIQNPTPGQLKLGHMGVGRIKAIYNSPDNAPITDVVEPEALAANPQWQGLLTVGDLKRWAEENQAQYGAGSAGAQAGVQGGAQGGGQQQFLMTGSGVIATDGAPAGYGHTTTGVAPLPGLQSGPPETTGLEDGYQWQQGRGGQWGAVPIPGHPMEAPASQPPSTTGLSDGQMWQQGQDGQWGAAPIPGYASKANPQEYEWRVVGKELYRLDSATGDAQRVAAARDNATDRYKYQKVGNSVVQVEKATGDAKVVYEGPQGSPYDIKVVDGTVLRIDESQGKAEPIWTAPEKEQPPPTRGLPTGHQWQQGQGGWEAAPIAGLPPEQEGGQVLGQGGAQSDRVMNTLLEMGYSRSEAFDMAAMVKPYTDPLSGQIGLLNIRTGEPVRPKARGQAAGSGSQRGGRGPFPANGQQPVQMDPQQQSALQQIQVAEGAPTLFDLAEDTAGLGSWLENAATRVGGMFDLGGFPATTSARQYVKAAQQQLITALSINARNPVAEQERLREQIDLDPQIFDSTEALQARQVAVDQLLRQKLAAEQRIVDDLSQSPQARRQAQMKASAIGQFLAILGVPPVIRNKAQYDALPPGTEYWHATENETRIKGGQ